MEKKRMDWRGEQDGCKSRSPLNKENSSILGGLDALNWKIFLSTIAACSQCYHLQCVSSFSHQIKRKHGDTK